MYNIQIQDESCMLLSATFSTPPLVLIAFGQMNTLLGKCQTDAIHAQAFRTRYFEACAVFEMSNDFSIFVHGYSIDIVLR